MGDEVTVLKGHQRALEERRIASACARCSRMRSAREFRGISADVGCRPPASATSWAILPLRCAARAVSGRRERVTISRRLRGGFEGWKRSMPTGLPAKDPGRLGQ